LVSAESSQFNIITGATGYFSAFQPRDILEDPRQIVVILNNQNSPAL